MIQIFFVNNWFFLIDNGRIAKYNSHTDSQKFELEKNIKINFKSSLLNSSIFETSNETFMYVNKISENSLTCIAEIACDLFSYRLEINTDSEVNNWEKKLFILL